MSVLENEFRRIRGSLDDALLDLCAHEDFVGLRDTIQRLGEVRRISSQIARHLERNRAVVENFGVYEPLPDDESVYDSDDADADVDTTVDELNNQFKGVDLEGTTDYFGQVEDHLGNAFLARTPNP